MSGLVTKVHNFCLFNMTNCKTNMVARLCKFFQQNEVLKMKSILKLNQSVTCHRIGHTKVLASGIVGTVLPRWDIFTEVLHNTESLLSVTSQASSHEAFGLFLLTSFCCCWKFNLGLESYSRLSLCVSKLVQYLNLFLVLLFIVSIWAAIITVCFSQFAHISYSLALLP